jgi:hypothetical protein
MKKYGVMVAACAVLLLVGGAATASAQSEQIIFSGVGFGEFNGTPTPVGFWIWCQDENPSPNAEYAGECAGAMYFYALGITKAVEGEVEEGEPDGVYIMTVTSRKGTSISCMLTNELNTDGEISQGPNNTVDVNCASPSGIGQSTNAVVNVTGPSED